MKPIDKSKFLLVLRYFIVLVATVVLACTPFMLLVDYNMDLAFLFLVILFITIWYITLPCTVVWIYSFVKSIRHRTKHDKILRWFHIVDLVLLVVIGIIANSPETKCDAPIMEAHYREHRQEFRMSVDNARRCLPDSTKIDVEFNRWGQLCKFSVNDKEIYRDFSGIALECFFEHNPDVRIYEPCLEGLRGGLKQIGCRGVSIDNYNREPYSQFLFRLIGLGAYYYRIYDTPLTDEEMQELGEDPHLIVFDRETVFCFCGGAVGPQRFEGKKEYLQQKDSTRYSDVRRDMF